MIKKSKTTGKKLLSKILQRGLGISVAMVIGSSLLPSMDATVAASDLRMRADIHPTSTGTSIATSSGGATVVNIQNPENGISYNNYDRFNLDYEDSAILNNSTKTGESIIGGTVKANPNLQNEAQVIVNEISGPMSKLSGNLEVFGNKADLIIANENGLLVDGANFINTSSLTLTNGNIVRGTTGFDIAVRNNTSSINIGEYGLNTDSSTLNLLGSNINIDGPINAEEINPSDINIIAGANNFAYADNNLVMTNRESTGTATTPISMSEYGSMYGNNIYILSNNKQATANLQGDIHAESNLGINANGTVALHNVDAGNINLKATESIINTGTIAARHNLDINAPKIINKSTLSGEVRTDITKDVTEQNNRVRDYIYYYDFVIKEKNGVKYTSDLQLNKATLKAGGSININRHMDNGIIVNDGGDIIAGQDINVKGDISSNTLVQSVKVTDALSKIEVDTHWERRSLVDGRWFSDGEATETNSMLKTLLKIAHTNDDWASVHYYEALKQIKDPDMVSLLNGLLGGDWRTRTKIKRPIEWNMDATINFSTNSQNTVSAGNNFKVVGNSVRLGNDFTNKSTINKVDDQEFTSIVADVNRRPSTTTVQAKNIALKAADIKLNNTNITATNILGLDSANSITTKGSYLTGNTALITANGDVAMSSQLSFDEQGNQVVAGESGIKTNNGLSLGAHNISLRGTELSATNGAVKIDATNVAGHDVNIVKSSYVVDRKDPYWLGFDSYKNNKELTAQILPIISKIEAKDVQINTINDLDLQGSVVMGADDTSSIKLQAGGDIHIANSDIMNYRKYSSDMRGKWDSNKYSFLKLQNALAKKVAVLPSNLESGGNIDIDARNLQVIGSKLIAGKDLNMRIQHNLDILAQMNTEKNTLFNLDWDILSLHSKTDKLASDTVAGSTVRGKIGLGIYVTGDMTTESARIAGGTVDLTVGGNYTNTAKQNITDKYSNQLDAGFNANGKLALAGIGASGSVNTATGTTNHAVSGPLGILDKDNDFKAATLTGGVGMELHYNDEHKHDEITVPTNIVGTNGDVHLTAGGNAEIGNSNIVSAKDVTVEAGSISTHNLTNKSTESTNKLDLSIHVQATASNPTVSKVNDLLNKVGTIKDKFTNKDIEGTIKEVTALKDGAVDLYKGLPQAIKDDDIVRMREEYAAAASYKHTYDSTKDTTVNNVVAKEDVTLTANAGNLELNSSKVQATNVKLAGDKVHIGSGTSDKVHTEDGISLDVTVNRDYAISPKDGIKGTITVAPNAKYEGATNVEHSVKPSTIEGTNVAYDANTVDQDKKSTTYYKDNRHIGAGGNLTIGLSSNHLVVADGSFSGDAGYNFATGHTMVNSITGKDVTIEANGGINVSGSINADGTGGKVSVNTNDTNLAVNNHNVLTVPGKELVSREFEHGNLKPAPAKEPTDKKVKVTADDKEISLNVGAEKYAKVPYNDIIENVVPEVFDVDTQWLIDMGLLTPVASDTSSSAEATPAVEETPAQPEATSAISTVNLDELDADTRMLVEMGLLTL